MNEKALREYIVGLNIDDLVTLDLRGYGISRIIQAAARQKHGGQPLCLNVARMFMEHTKPGDTVYIFTGFVFSPYGKGELDGLTGSALLARALVLALGVKPVIICEDILTAGMKNVLMAAGLNAYDTLAECVGPVSAAVYGVSAREEIAAKQRQAILEMPLPAAMITVERGGRNEKGEYHLGGGANVSHLAGKIDDLFAALREKGVPNAAIGDLGNELGMGGIAEAVKAYVPFGAQCQCDCGGGICADVAADNILTATTSDWGCYGLCAALAFLTGKIDVLHDAYLEQRVLEAANRNDFLDGSGWNIPAIDGTPLDYNLTLVRMLRYVVEQPMQSAGKYSAHFERVVKLGFFSEQIGGQE